MTGLTGTRARLIRRGVNLGRWTMRWIADPKLRAKFIDACPEHPLVTYAAHTYAEREALRAAIAYLRSKGIRA